MYIYIYKKKKEKKKDFKKHVVSLILHCRHVLDEISRNYRSI